MAATPVCLQVRLFVSSNKMCCNLLFWFLVYYNKVSSHHLLSLYTGVCPVTCAISVNLRQCSVVIFVHALTVSRVVLGLGNLGEAEQYLLQAQWTVLKTPQCSNTIRHKLSRYLGLLYATKRQFSHALRQLAYDVSTVHLCRLHLLGVLHVLL